jgi:hypothetical protein
MQPEDVAAEFRSRLAEQQERAAELRAIADLLPALVRDWQLGELAPTAHPATEVISGSEAQWAFWDDLLGSGPPTNPVAVFPDLAVLFALLSRLDPSRSATITAAGTRSRVLTRPESLAQGAAIGSPVFGTTTPGIELRTVASARGWLLAVPGMFAVLPLHWDDPTPETIVVTREPTVVAALAAYFEELWLDSAPLPGTPAEWRPVLTLLGQGLSDGAIAAALGWSVRTVRRRIAEASAALGAGSRFELGVAWERSR